MYRQDLEAMGDRAFDAALNAHLHAIDMAEDREEWIEQRALELRKAHGPFPRLSWGRPWIASTENTRRTCSTGRLKPRWS